MSQNRKDLKLMSLFLLIMGIAVPASELVLNVFGSGEVTPAFLTMVCVLSAVGLVTGWLGTRAANVPTNTQPFIYGAIATIVLGAAFTLFNGFTLGWTNNVDVYLGVIFGVTAAIGLYYAFKVRDRVLNKK